MPNLILVRPYHSLEDEFGHLSKFGYIEISNGLCWLAASARKSGYAVDIIDALPLKLDNEALADEIAGKKPKAVGISACTMDIMRSGDLADRLKKKAPNIKVIIGGPHITAVPDETMERFPSFDIGALGEGEETIVEIMDALTGKTGRALKDVAGIIFRNGSSLVITPPRRFIENLDSLPMPAWELLPDLANTYFPPAWTMHSGKTVTIITSRGCPFQCIYCDRKVFGNRVRYHGTQYVMEMIRTMYQRYGITHFRISDDNFIAHKKRLHEICDAIMAEKLAISWSCLARVDSIDPETLDIMRKAGCWSIAFGVETGSQKIHDIEKKGVSLDKIAKAVAMTRKAGIKTISFNIIGHPMETAETIKETIDFNKRIKVDEFKTQFMTPFPGTELYEMAEKYGTLDRDWSKMGVFKEPIFIPYGLTKEEMVKWNKTGFRSFYTQPRIILSYIRQVKSSKELWLMIMGGATLVYWTIAELFAPRRKVEV